MESPVSPPGSRSPEASSESGRRLLFCRHGILLNRFFFLPLELYFRRHGYTVINRGYPTTRRTIEEHGQDLHREVLEVARPGDEIHFLTHSLGGLVLRYALTHHEFPPLARAVQLVPPNRGSEKARHYRDDPLFRWLYGPHAGRQLTEDPPGIFEHCGRPRQLELGIIAGTGSPPQIFHSCLSRPHDGVVTLEEARLEGYPIRELDTGHTTCLFRPRVWREVRSFLETGKFLEEEKSGGETPDTDPSEMAT